MDIAYKDEGRLNYSKIWWLDRFMMSHKGFIAGGCFKSIFQGERVKDVDVFFESERDFVEAELYFAKNESFTKHYENEKVVAFKDKSTSTVAELVRSVYGVPQKVIGSFDFSVTKFAYYKKYEEDGTAEYRCLFHPLYFEHLTMKRLVIDEECPFPISTFERMLRYAKYGFFPCRETKKRIITEINAIQNLTDADIPRSLYNGLD